MPYKIIHDIEEDISAVVDPVLGRALGPIAAGAGGRAALESFIDAMNVDPSTIPGHLLEPAWESFMKAITDIEDAVKDGAGDIHDGEQALTGADIIPGAADTPDPPAAPPVDQPVEVTKPAPTTTTQQDPDYAPPSTVGKPVTLPVTEPASGMTICPKCGGFGSIVVNGQETTCPECHGTGQVPTPTDIKA